MKQPELRKVFFEHPVKTVAIDLIKSYFSKRQIRKA
jgi:hypothetical protein